MINIKNFFSKKFILRSIGIIIFLFIVIFKIDFKDFYQIIKQINYGYLIVFVVVFFLFTPLHPWRWQYILKRFGINITFIDSYYMVFVSTLLGLITPAKIGEIGARVSFFLKDKDSVKKVLTGVILERVLDVIFLLLFASLAVLFFIKLLPFKFSLIASVILLVFAVTILLVVKRKFETLFKKIIYFIIPPRYEKFYQHLSYFYSNFKSIKAGDYLVIIFLTFISRIASFIVIYIFAKSVGINISFIYFAMVSAVAGLVALLPISISGLGTKEASYIILFAPFSISIEKIVAFSVASTLSLILLLSLTGLVCWLFKPAKFDQLNSQE